MLDGEGLAGQGRFGQGCVEDRMEPGMSIALKMAGYGCFLIAAITLVAGNMPDVVRIAAVLSCGLTGLVFLGLARVLDLLGDIKGALTPVPADAHVDVVHEGRPLRSLEQLGEELERLQGKRASS
jgi:hypothetical protein